MNKPSEEIEKKKRIAEYVKDWMNSYEPDTFVKNEHGVYIYRAGHSGINLESFFEDLLLDYIDSLPSEPKENDAEFVEWLNKIGAISIGNNEWEIGGKDFYNDWYSTESLREIFKQSKTK